MPPSKTILLRFESKNGQFRLSVDPADDFSSLTSNVLSLEILGRLPSITDTGLDPR